MHFFSVHLLSFRCCTMASSSSAARPATASGLKVEVEWCERSRTWKWFSKEDEKKWHDENRPPPGWCERTNTWKKVSKEADQKWPDAPPPPHGPSASTAMQRHRTKGCKYRSTARGCDVGCTDRIVYCHHYFRTGRCNYGDSCPHVHKGR